MSVFVSSTTKDLGKCRQAVNRGFVLVILSVNSVQSEFVKRELQYSLEKASHAKRVANIIPIMIDDPNAVQTSMPPDLQLLLSNIQWIDFSQGDYHNNFQKLVAEMKSRDMD
jgi:TIR domain